MNENLASCYGLEGSPCRIYVFACIAPQLNSRVDLLRGSYFQLVKAWPHYGLG